MRVLENKSDDKINKHDLCSLSLIMGVELLHNSK